MNLVIWNKSNRRVTGLTSESDEFGDMGEAGLLNQIHAVLTRGHRSLSQGQFDGLHERLQFPQQFCQALGLRIDPGT